MFSNVNVAEWPKGYNKGARVESSKLKAQSLTIRISVVGQPTVAANRGRHGGRPYFELSALSFQYSRQQALWKDISKGALTGAWRIWGMATFCQERLTFKKRLWPFRSDPNYFPQCRDPVQPDQKLFSHDYLRIQMNGPLKGVEIGCRYA